MSKEYVLPEIGTKIICKKCGEEKIYNGDYWVHVDKHSKCNHHDVDKDSRYYRCYDTAYVAYLIYKDGLEYAVTSGFSADRIIDDELREKCVLYESLSEDIRKIADWDKCREERYKKEGEEEKIWEEIDPHKEPPREYDYVDGFSFVSPRLLEVSFYVLSIGDDPDIFIQRKFPDSGWSCAVNLTSDISPGKNTFKFSVSGSDFRVLYADIKLFEDMSEEEKKNTKDSDMCKTEIKKVL